MTTTRVTEVTEQLVGATDDGWTSITTDVSISSEARGTVNRVLSAELRSSRKARLVASDAVAADDEVLAEDYREMADEMLGIARDARSAQVRALLDD